MPLSGRARRLKHGSTPARLRSRRQGWRRLPPRKRRTPGLWPRQAIRAGQAVRSAWLQSPLSVRPGDTVRVAVRNGGALLEFEARAENSGAIGETIYVRNPDSQHRFRARVTAAGRVAVDDSAAGIQEFGP